MPSLHVRNITSATLATWKKAAIDGGISLRAWVIRTLGDSEIQSSHQLVTKPKEVVPSAPVLERAFKGGRPDRDRLAFVRQYNREPKTVEELEGFKKRGW